MNKPKIKPEEFITHKPKNPFLQKIISYYYFHKTSNETTNKQYIYYPNFRNALTIYKNSRIEFGHQYSKSYPDESIEFSILFSGIQKQFRKAEINSPFDKIGIVFQELGINHFIKEPLSYIHNHPTDKSFHHFGDEFYRLLGAVFNENKVEEKVQLLDNFFLSNYIPFKEGKLINAIDVILTSRKKVTVQEICNSNHIHRKTLLRLFQKHLCCTTKDFIDIVQFRKALNDYLLINKDISLTQTAFDNQYYDQAQFITHFKKLTGNNPKRFFKNIQHLGGEDTFWSFQ